MLPTQGDASRPRLKIVVRSLSTSFCIGYGLVWCWNHTRLVPVQFYVSIGVSLNSNVCINKLVHLSYGMDKHQIIGKKCDYWCLIGS